LLIVDIELGLMKDPVVPIGALAFLYLLHTGMPVQIQGPEILIVCVTKVFVSQA